MQAATDPWATGVSYERFMLDRVRTQCTEWLGHLRRGEPVMVNGRNIQLEWERANKKLQETGGLARDQTARERYGMLSV